MVTAFAFAPLSSSQADYSSVTAGCSDYSESSWGFYYGSCDADMSSRAKSLLEGDADEACSAWCSELGCDYLAVDFDDNLSCHDDSVRTEAPCLGSTSECVKAAPGNGTSVWEFTCKCFANPTVFSSELFLGGKVLLVD